MKKQLLTILALTLIGTAGAQTTHFSMKGPLITDGSMYYGNIGAVQRPDGSFVTVEKSNASGFFIRTFSSDGVLQGTTKIVSSACYVSTVSSVTAMGTNSLLVTGMGTAPAGYGYFVARLDLVTNVAYVTTKLISGSPYTAGPKVSTDGSSVFALYPNYNQYDINKYDANLNPLWSKTCEVDSTSGKNPGMDCEMTDSTIVVVGKCDSYMGMGNFDSNTGLLNSFKIYYAGYNRMYSITKTADGNFLVAGMHSNTYAGIGSPLIAKLSGNGDVLWVKIMNMSSPGATFGRFVDVQELPDGKIAGFATSYDAFADTYADGVCMMDNTGNLLWAKSFSDANGYNHFYDIKVCPDGMLMSGTYYDMAGNNNTLMTFTDFNFNQVCNTTPVTLTCNSYYLGSTANVSPAQAHYATGIASTTYTMGTITSGGTETFTTCSMTTLGTEEETEVGSNVYPNPLNAGDVLYVEMETSALYEFVITDLSGKVISRQSVSGNRATLSTQGMATGAYLLNMVVNNRTVAVKKLMVK